MYKIKVTSLFLTALVGSSIAIADYVPSSDKDNSTFQCSASTAYVDGTPAPTASVETKDRLVRGLCADGGNSVNGTTLGTVIGPKGGHLRGLPIWWKETDGTVRVLNDVCFNSKAIKGSWGRNKDGSAGILPETGQTSITCHEGCSGQKLDFGSGGYC